MRVWIGCLACYNEGTLRGQWFDAAEAGDVTPEKLHPGTFATTPIGLNPASHEEMWCFDIEDMPPGFMREMSPMEAQQVADAYAEIEEQLHESEIDAYFAWLEDGGYAGMTAETLADHVSDFQDHYSGTWDSFLDYAYDYVDSCGLLGDDDSIASRYFDYQAFARDLQMDFTVIDAGGAGVHVFHS
jgi:antirestriction protein